MNIENLSNLPRRRLEIQKVEQNVKEFLNYLDRLWFINKS